jgi:hypothetical protein
MANKYNTKGARNQDLISARAELKQFRRDVSILKKSGLIDKLKYDARSVTPTKYLKSQIRKFTDVITGNAQTVKVSKPKQKYYSEKGYAVKGGRVVVPKHKDEKVYATHGDFRKVSTHPTGKITTLDLGLSTKDIGKWKEQLLSKKIKLKEGERLAFSFDGNNSYMTFRTPEQLLDYLENYEDIENMEDRGSAARQSQIIKSIVIFKTEKTAWGKTPWHGTERQAEARQRNQTKRQAWIGRMNEYDYNNFLNKKADAEQARRNKIKNSSPETYAKEKEKAKERMRKTRAAKKNPK